MTRTGRTALKFVLDARKSDTIGTDILVPEKAFAALEALPAERDRNQRCRARGCGRKYGPGRTPNDLPPAIAETAQSTPRAIPQGSPVIIATIDDGIGIANHRFRQGPTETRVKHFLDLALIGEPTVHRLGR